MSEEIWKGREAALERYMAKGKSIENLPPIKRLRAPSSYVDGTKKKHKNIDHDPIISDAELNIKYGNVGKTFSTKLEAENCKRDWKTKGFDVHICRLSGGRYLVSKS